MANGKQLEINIGGQPVDITDDVQVNISYKLEDESDFQQKKSSEAVTINIPATLGNEIVSGSFGNISVLDIPDTSRDATIICDGTTLLQGKAFLRKVYHDSKLLSYDYDFFGNNANWIIAMQNLTLYDILKDIQFTYNTQNIGDTWTYDGWPDTLDPSDPNYRPFKNILVFAPVRDGRAWDTYSSYTDSVFVADRSTPSLSVFYIIDKAFKSVGYSIKSAFFDTNFFRRLVMPWTWGNFTLSTGTKIDNLLIDVSNIADVIVSGVNSFTGYMDMNPEKINKDPNGCYSYDATNKFMDWTYSPSFSFGTLNGSFVLELQYKMFADHGNLLYVRWFKNGTQIQEDRIVNGDTAATGNASPTFEVSVNPSDVISCGVYVASTGTVNKIDVELNVTTFNTPYFKQGLGSSISFENYLSLKNYKFLDMLRGIVDCFDLSIQTDDVRRMTVIEPTHSYSLMNDLSSVNSGYFNDQIIDMNAKQDLSKKSDVTLFNDTNRAQVFRYKNDTSDGGITGINNKRSCEVGAAKYTLPDRFSDDDETSNENRFFSPLVHVQMTGLTTYNGGAPLNRVFVPALLPENISDTSASTSQNTLMPKLAYYKGSGNKIFFMSATTGSGVGFPYLPEMFSVNYMSDGSNDPNLNYNDELVNGNVIPGLLRRFFLKRMAITRQGIWYDTFLRLNNVDILNFFHREYIALHGQKLELVQINNYNPRSDDSTSVLLRKDAGITQQDLANCAPSVNSVKKMDQASLLINDLPYWPAAIASPTDFNTKPI